MATNPSTLGARPITPNVSRDRLATPAKWRVGQTILLVLVALLAIYYGLVGYRDIGITAPNPADFAGFGVLAALVYLCTPTTATIALTTFHEAIRRRWMTALLAFGLVIIALSTFFTWMQPGEEEKFLRDFGLGFVILITLLMAIFLGVALVPPDIERRTIFTILAKPVNRLEFLLGKFLGLSLTLAMNLAFMGAMFLLSYAAFKVRRAGGLGPAIAGDANDLGLWFDLGNLAKALFLHYGALIVMAALALTVSLLLSGIAAIVVSFIVYFAGQASSYWEHLSGGGATASLPTLVATLVRGVYAILPRLDRFDVRERLINDAPIAFSYGWRAFGSGLVYAAALLAIAYFAFSDREF